MKFTTFEPAQSHYKLNQKSVQGDLGHTPYKKNINYEKCAGIGLNGFILKKILMRKNGPESRLGFAFIFLNMKPLRQMQVKTLQVPVVEKTFGTASMTF